MKAVQLRNNWIREEFCLKWPFSEIEARWKTYPIHSMNLLNSPKAPFYLINFAIHMLKYIISKSEDDFLARMRATQAAGRFSLRFIGIWEILNFYSFFLQCLKFFYQSCNLQPTCSPNLYLTISKPPWFEKKMCFSRVQKCFCSFFPSRRKTVVSRDMILSTIFFYFLFFSWEFFILWDESLMMTSFHYFIFRFFKRVQISFFLILSLFFTFLL